MKILLTGGRGQLAHAIAAVAHDFDLDCIVTDRNTLDVSQRIQVHSVLRRYIPDLVINCAAYTQVDAAETEPALAYQVNSMSALHLAQACHELKIRLLHVSTDYVFGSQKVQKRWRENDNPSPLNTYGWSKRVGEVLAQTSCASCCVVRVSGLFSAMRQSFVWKILSRVANGVPLQVVSDQYTTPTNCAQLAVCLLQLGEYWCQGGEMPPTLHIAGGPTVSWFEFAQRIIALHPNTKFRTWPVQPIASATLAMTARRPSWSVLDDSLARSLCRLTLPDWRAGLKDVVYETWASVSAG